jgi:hypothetical protein
VCRLLRVLERLDTVLDRLPWLAMLASLTWLVAVLAFLLIEWLRGR